MKTNCKNRDSTRSSVCSEPAERAVLGSMLKDPNVIPDVVQVLRKESFYFDAHQRIFVAIVALWDEFKPADQVTIGEHLANHLHAQKQIENIGGYGYIGDLITDTGTAANVMHYADIVAEHWKIRELRFLGQQLEKDSTDRIDTADEIMAQFEQKLVALSEPALST